MRFILQALLALAMGGFSLPAQSQSVSPAAAAAIRQYPQVLDMAPYVLNQALRDQTFERLNRTLPPSPGLIDDGPVIRYENMTIPPAPIRPLSRPEYRRH